jgi:hypothetical protein
MNMMQFQIRWGFLSLLSVQGVDFECVNRVSMFYICIRLAKIKTMACMLDRHEKINKRRKPKGMLDISQHYLSNLDLELDFPKQYFLQL